jgi:hypothetical protein
VAHPAPTGSLIEFLAVRLILERLALAHVASEALQFTEPLARLRHALRSQTHKHEPTNVEQRALLVFQLAQILGWLPVNLHHLTKKDWSTLVEEIEFFSNLERRRIFHQAFERQYRLQTLDAVSVRAEQPITERGPARFQTIHCIDEREESLRRHLEELAPQVETFAVAGFFCVPMYYRGAAEAHFVPLCPVVVRPQHWVVEDVVYTSTEEHRRRAKARRAIGTAWHHLHVGSRTFTLGAVLAAGFGALASIPLVARVLFPRVTAQIRHAFGRLVQPPPMTKLQLERVASDSGPQEGHFGFTVQEMAGIAERVLRDIGLTYCYSRLIFAIGHGSRSLNNPHESAHDCGACGGAVGGPNARAIAQIMNDPRVRAILRDRGIELPDETFFIGALHNTCDDSLTIYDLDRLPKSHQQEFEEARAFLEAACDRDAHERHVSQFFGGQTAAIELPQQPVFGINLSGGAGLQ